jgi:hypothetical protein
MRVLQKLSARDIPHLSYRSPLMKSNAPTGLWLTGLKKPRSLGSAYSNLATGTIGLLGDAA